MTTISISQAPSHATPSPELNVTPLIDVLLVLLTMLILTLPLLTHAIRIDLPYGVPPRAEARPTVELDIDAEGNVFWNGTAVAGAAALERRFRESGLASSQPDVKIWPDRRSRYERVAQVMAAAQRSGVERIALAPSAP
jgi:biopolymer transport protein ExbD